MKQRATTVVPLVCSIVVGALIGFLEIRTIVAWTPTTTTKSFPTRWHSLALPSQQQRQRQSAAPFVLASSSSTTANHDDHDADETSTPSLGYAVGQLRRRELLLLGLTTGSCILSSMPSIANAGLLDEYGTDPKKIVTPPKSATASSGPIVKPDVEINPSLRGSYYYPTAKKRYLPRIIKVSKEIGNVPNAIEQNDWVTVAEFGKVAENAILPLQLYQSSLDGQGLSMNNSFAKVMKEDAVRYERAYQVFTKALRQQNCDLALQAVSDMGVAIADYRQQGRLSDDDGNIPSVDDMRRMAMRRPTGAYNKY